MTALSVLLYREHERKFVHVFGIEEKCTGAGAFGPDCLLHGLYRQDWKVS